MVPVRVTGKRPSSGACSIEIIVRFALIAVSSSFLSTTTGPAVIQTLTISPAIYPNEPKTLDFSDESSNQCLYRRHFHAKQHPVTMLGGGSHGGVRQRCRCPTHRRADLHHLVRSSRRLPRSLVARSLSPTTTIAVLNVHHVLLDAFLLISWVS